MLYLKYLWLTHEINSWTFFVYSWESLGFIKSSCLVKRNDFWIPTYFNRVVLLGYSTISHPSMECQNNIWDIVHTTLKMLWYSLPLIFHLLLAQMLTVNSSCNTLIYQRCKEGNFKTTISQFTKHGPSHTVQTYCHSHHHRLTHFKMLQFISNHPPR